MELHNLGPAFPLAAPWQSPNRVSLICIPNARQRLRRTSTSLARSARRFDAHLIANATNLAAVNGSGQASRKREPCDDFPKTNAALRWPQQRKTHCSRSPRVRKYIQGKGAEDSTILRSVRWQELQMLGFQALLYLYERPSPFLCWTCGLIRRPFRLQAPPRAGNVHMIDLILGG